MKSKITALDAKRLVAKYNGAYTKICETIEQAARNGEHEVTVKEITCYKIRARLVSDNFDLTCNKDKGFGNYTHRIWWGD